MSVPAVAETQETEQGQAADSTGRTGVGAPNAQEPRVDPTQVSSAETQEQAQRGPDFFRQAFNQIRGYTQAAAPAPNPQVEPPAKKSPAPQAPPVSSGPVPEPGAPTAPDTGQPAPARTPGTTLPPREQRQQPQQDRIVLSQAELDRRVQAEADRKIAKQQHDDRIRAEREREVELRRTDPFEYARLVEQREKELEVAQEETRRLTGTLSQQLNQYDRNVLDIFVSAIPETHRAKVISKTEGIPGRKETAAATLNALKSLWTAEGRASAKADLMKDQAFVKEVLARYGGQTPEPETTPTRIRPQESAGTNGANGVENGSNNQAVNAWMRSATRDRITSGR